MSEHHDIYVRAHTVRVESAQQDTKSRYNEVKWADCALIVDCETRVSADQTLTFGFSRFCELRNGQYVTVGEGIFHDDKLSARELNVLRRYIRHTKPDTTDDGCDRLYLYSRSEFVEEVLGIAIQANAFIVCFNSGFDLSRFAVDWETAANGGWSLILSRWRDPKTRKVMPNKFFPRIVIKALNSKTAIIHSTRAPMSERDETNHKVALWPPARFLDLRTLLWALRNRSYSLESACRDEGIRSPSHRSRPRSHVQSRERCQKLSRRTKRSASVRESE
jgi:hypothetical protein